MLNEEVVEKVNDAMARLCDRYGYGPAPKLEGWVLNIAAFRFPHEVGLERGRLIRKMAKGLMRLVPELEWAEPETLEEYKDDPEELEWLLSDRNKGLVFASIAVEAKPPYWHKDVEEERRWDEEMEEMERLQQERSEELKRAAHERMAKDYLKHLIPVPPPSASRPTELYLTMAYEPYDQIKSGEKVTEFRAYCETWVKRILANLGTLRTVKFQRGYGGPGRPKPEQMVWTIRNVALYDIYTRETSDPLDVKVGFVPTHIAIDLGVRMDDAGPSGQRDA